MEPRFTTRSILLATAFVGICLAGVLAALREHPDFHWPIVAVAGLIAAPMLVPCVFIAYAIGRRRLAWGLVLTFAVAEFFAVYACFFYREIREAFSF